MTATAKMLVVGPPDGDQGALVSAISEVKVRSSARNPSGESFVPMDFGRVKISIDLDLQLFGFERDQVGVVTDAISPGIVGALLLIERQDLTDPHYAVQALIDLAERGIVTLIAVPADLHPGDVVEHLQVPPDVVVAPLPQVDRVSVKSLIVSLLEAAMAAAEGSAA